MRIAVSGTYSTGKTLTTLALANLSGIPRSAALTMRELLPIAVPGKILEDCTASEIIGLIVRRNQGRAVSESHLPSGFISDGSSLHEWCYGTVRVMVGINPNDSVGSMDDVEMTPEMAFYAGVMNQIGSAAKHYAQSAYDIFFHLPIEFDLVADGHRPVSERFRQLADQMLRETVEELGLPLYEIGGSIEDRLAAMIDVLGVDPVMSIEEAIEAARKDYAAIDTTLEVSK